MGMSDTFFIGDTHFFHKNIIKYENRPFQDTIEMNEVLIKNWNKTVRNSDRVFMLGDFALTNRAGLNEVGRQLNGYKILVKGNHDQYNNDAYYDAGFNEVVKYPIIIDSFWILSHEPLYINENMPYANIFGHVHSNPAYMDYTSQTFCVSVERKHMNYKPISFDKIKELMGVAEKDNRDRREIVENRESN
jgi:calcineurin-like phosphoesterase family protein